MQVDFDVAPSSSDYYPLWQQLQLVEHVFSCYCPFGHVSHVLSAICPLKLDYVPDGQHLQLSEHSSGWYVPAWHFMQWFLVVEPYLWWFYPFGQQSYDVEARFSTWLPGGLGSHVDIEVALSMLDYVPLGQGVHSFALDGHVVPSLYYPGRHGSILLATSHELFI